MAQRLKTKVCSAHPYASWEKGNIQNTNKLIRQYIPKGTAFEQYNDQLIKQIQMKINARPRKNLISLHQNKSFTTTHINLHLLLESTQ
ncbi:hypothetical protein [Bacteroides zoogleoformans]|uniref:hypothetical protein n=1 Tax=Bacteroides zoogleoformans TaxID=28119 RepID=UPI0021D1C4A4|nr:hypothetical protein [Bacteroides zoogleoformans]